MILPLPMQKTWFRDWFNSPYYHQLYAHRDDREAADFINALIKKLSPPAGAKMLDIACGKGRHAVQLAEKGFDVTGIDLSRESILEALKEEKENLHFYEHDMRLPFWINYFDYGFNFFTSFGYFDTKREHDNALRTIAQSLKPGGTFVMDFINIKKNDLEPVPAEEKVLEGVTYSISKRIETSHIFKDIEVRDPELPQALKFSEQVARFTYTDFRSMFAAQGMTINECFGDYNFGAFDEDYSPRLIMIAEKRER